MGNCRKPENQSRKARLGVRRCFNPHHHNRQLRDFRNKKGERENTVDIATNWLPSVKIPRSNSVGFGEHASI